MYYSFGQMCGDLRVDWRKYVEMFRPAPPDRRPNALRVLLASPGLFVVAGYRLAFWIRAQHEETGNYYLKCLLKAVNYLSKSFAVIAMKTSISHWPVIGPGLYLSNKGGITLGLDEIGADCTIHHKVTIGMGKSNDRAVVGDRVWIGPNTVIYGGIRIGSGVVIRGVTVLGKSIPDNSVVSGKPGRIEKRNCDNSALLRNPDTCLDPNMVDTVMVSPSAEKRSERCE